MIQVYGLNDELIKARNEIKALTAQRNFPLDRASIRKEMKELKALVDSNQSKKYSQLEKTFLAVTFVA